MKQGGRTSATWDKGKKPPVTKPRGCKHKRTVLKEAIGLQNWDGLKEFIEKNGATKLINEMMRLHGREYVNAFASLCEYVRPKLTRVAAEVSAPNGRPLLSATDLTPEEIRYIAESLKE